MSLLNQNRINATINPATMIEINEGVLHIMTLLPGAGNITLADDERKGLLSMDVDNRVQVTKVLDVMAGPSGAYIPNFITAVQINTDATLFDQLEQIEGSVTDLLQRISDLKRLAAHEAVTGSNAVYGIIEIAAKAGLPGAQAAYDTLKQRFAGQGGGAPSQQGA